MRGFDDGRPDPTSLLPAQKAAYETRRVVAWDTYQAKLAGLAGLHWTELEDRAALARSDYRSTCEEAYREVVHGLHAAS